MQAGILNEEASLIPASETDQAKLVLELQKENSELRQQLMRQQQRLLTLQAQTLASNSSPCPPAPSPSPLLSPSRSAPRKPRRSILSGNCFGTPSSGASVSDVTAATVKAFEAEIERLKKDHALQLMQKDDFIRELLAGKESRRVVTRATVSKGERSAAGGELKSPNHRFVSPVHGTKKRSFCDIGSAAGGSPLVGAGNGRRTRSHVAPATPPAPSMLVVTGMNVPFVF